MLNITKIRLLDAQKKITISLIVYISGFLVTWLPYSFILLYNTFRASNDPIPNVTNFSLVISKTAFVWSTLLFMFTNRNIRSKLNRKIFLKANKNLNQRELVPMYFIT